MVTFNHRSCVLTSSRLLISVGSIGFALGAMASSVMMSVVRGGVNTLIVCFADSPARMEEEHPQLTKEILEAWAKAFPSTFPCQINSLTPPTAEPVTTSAYT